MASMVLPYCVAQPRPKPRLPCARRSRKHTFLQDDRQRAVIRPGGGALHCFVGEGPFCKKVSSPTPPPPKTLIFREARIYSVWRTCFTFLKPSRTEVPTPAS
ncbi:hypothetical protein KL86DES1_21044 [uncultured Desulfovibrio sp.]|uniref:Uncharacterized protein n=1 Tax=uncultured Desulfovibrio sp. TaxID=167968 RepID=A0A212L6H2_9BACT|nr:hypothetical protein KL86DES1_21044 [uncultured Desulfovibrio sp.]VZH33943.1 conserved protein of unknown function [Desulfovibrio sp. 86]